MGWVGGVGKLGDMGVMGIEVGVAEAREERRDSMNECRKLVGVPFSGSTTN